MVISTSPTSTKIPKTFNMLSLFCSSSLFNTLNTHKDSTFLPISITKSQSLINPFQFSKNPSISHHKVQISSPKRCIFVPKSAESDSEAETSGDVDVSAVGTVENEWLSRLPDKKKPLYAHSLPCIEAWLKSLGFYQSRDDRAVWFVEKPDWHAQLSLDITDLYIRYLKNGPGNLEKDMERRFSYALSREDIENAVLGGP